MANQTVPIPSNGSEFAWVYAVWISFFFTTALPNLLISISVLRYEALRACKEYLVIAALCFTDFLTVSYYPASGVHRLHIIISDRLSELRSVLSCITLPHNLLTWFSSAAYAIMLIVASLDRLIAVAAPLHYYAFTGYYACCMIVPVFAFGIFMFSLTLVFGFMQRHENSLISVFCYTGPIIVNTFKGYGAGVLYMIPLSAVISIVLYIFVGLVYWHKTKQVSDQATVQATVQTRRRQKALTKNLALSSACTFTFLVLPMLIGFTGDIFSWPRRWLQPLWLFPPVNSFCNVVIFYKRQPDLKQGVQSLLRNKQMPPDVEVWQNGRLATTAQQKK